MNLSGYVGHATIFSFMLDYCVLFSSRVRVRVRIRVRIRFGVRLVSCYAHVFVLYFRLSLSHCRNVCSVQQVGKWNALKLEYTY